MFKISTPRFGEDFHMFCGIVSQWIDSRLEGFTKSTFTLKGSRFYLEFHDDETQILLRRLLELEDNGADCWANDIVEANYGIKIGM